MFGRRSQGDLDWLVASNSFNKTTKNKEDRRQNREDRNREQRTEDTETETETETEIAKG